MIKLQPNAAKCGDFGSGGMAIPFAVTLEFLHFSGHLTKG
jgi:hypothetical protein